MNMLAQAQSVCGSTAGQDEEMVEYINTLRESVLEAYSGIVQVSHRQSVMRAGACTVEDSKTEESWSPAWIRDADVAGEGHCWTVRVASAAVRPICMQRYGGRLRSVDDKESPYVMSIRGGWRVAVAGAMCAAAVVLESTLRAPRPLLPPCASWR